MRRWRRTTSFDPGPGGTVSLGFAPDTNLSDYQGYSFEGVSSGGDSIAGNAILRRVDGGDFSLDSVSVRGLLTSQVVVASYKDGVQRGGELFSIGQTGFTVLPLDLYTSSYSGIDEVRFLPTGVGAILVLDDFVLTQGSGAATEDEPLAIDVLANDRDVDAGDSLTVGVAGGSEYGATLAVNADGTIQYDPTGAALIQALDEGETLDRYLHLHHHRRHGATDTATVSVVVHRRG